MGAAFKMFGPWNRFASFPGRLAKGLPKIAEKAINKEAQMVADALKETLEMGKAGGPGLSPITKAKKGHGIKLLQTHSLANSFTVEGVKAGKAGFVGIKEGTHHPSGISMTALATIQEFGTATIPPRPFLQPTLARVGPKMSQKVIKAWQKQSKRLW